MADTLTYAALREAVARGIDPQLWDGGDYIDRRELRKCADGALAAIAKAVQANGEELRFAADFFDGHTLAALLRALAEAGEART